MSTLITRRSSIPTLARWLVSFVGYPLGGVAAIALTGAVDTVPTALGGGAITGAAIGAAQGVALRGDRHLVGAWTLATAVGLAVGLGAAAPLVGFRTGLADLAVQGAVCGAAVGLAQAVVLIGRVGRRAWAWPLWLAVVWSVGWMVTAAIGVDVQARYTVFGSSGALTATVLTAMLPLVLARRGGRS